MSSVIRVAVVDDHPLFREGVSSIFSRSERHSIVALGGNADDAVNIAREYMPDVMLIDIKMPGGGLEAVRQISEICPAVKVVMLTSSEQEDDVSRGLSLGARGYVLKGIGARELIDTVSQIVNGGTYVSPQLAAQILINAKQPKAASKSDSAVSTLTRREEQILEQVADGLTNKEIARDLEISEKTVKHYMTNIMQKLQVRNRVEAALICHSRKMAG